jgi:predicted lipid-binding transport protein (Tim44 family)
VTDQPATAAGATEPATAPPPPADSGAGAASQLSARVDERPEMAVGGAFAGGLLLGLLLKRLAR